MVEETKNYIKYRTICPVPYECLTQGGTLTKQNVVVRERTDIQETVTTNEITLEKKQAIGQLITVLQRVSEQQQTQHRDLISMLQNLNAAKKTAGTTKNNTVTNKEDVKKAELLNKVLKSTQNVTVDAQIKRQNQTQIASLKNPYIGKKGVMFKKVTVTWNTIYFGSYPQIKETLLKNRMETNALRDEKGNYIYGNGQYARKFRKTIREYYEYQPIRWRVLDIKNGVATLFADQILDAMPYHNAPVDGSVTWEKSSLRRWLNEDYEGSFYQLAFSEEEKAAIVDRPTRQEKVTLLRHIEVMDKSYKSYGFYDLYQKGYLYIEGMNPNGYTDYAEGKAIFKKETFNGRTGAWWLKDTIASGTKAIEVNASGYIGMQGTNVDVKWIGVRPMIVVDLYKLNAVIKTGNPVEVVKG